MAFVKDRRLWLAVVILCVAFISVRYSAAGIEVSNPFRTAVAEVLRPFQLVVARTAAALNDGTSYLTGYKRTKDENLALRKELDSLRHLQTQVEELRQENERLRALLGFERASGLEGVSRSLAALVIARNSDTWFSSVVINRGARDGVREGAPVVTAQGLVGRVTRVTPNSSTVMLITDPQSGVGAMIQRQSSRAMGVAMGRGMLEDRLEMKFFSRDADVRRNDKVVTSSLSQVFPKGIPIGTVISVTSNGDGLVKYASIRPSVDFNRLEEVLVLLTVDQKGDAPAAPPERGRNP